MEISICSSYFLKTREANRWRSPEEVIRYCSEAGFRVLDFNPYIYNDDTWEQEIDRVMNAAAKYGVVIEQSHALANFYPRAPKEWFVKMLDRCAEAAVRMQIKDLVFHADEYYPAKGEPFDTDAALIQVCDVLAPSVEKLVKGGVRAAMETVFEDHYGVPKDQRSHFCGDIEELAAVIDRFNDPMVGCCWDFGHARIGVGDKNHADMIRRFGKKIFCTHVHDNVGYLRTDLHLPPFMGDIKWEEIMPALKEAGYEGSLTFELAYGAFPDDKVTEYAKELYHTGEVLVKMFEGSQKED